MVLRNLDIDFTGFREALLVEGPPGAHPSPLVAGCRIKCSGDDAVNVGGAGWWAGGRVGGRGRGGADVRLWQDRGAGSGRAVLCCVVLYSARHTAHTACLPARPASHAPLQPPPPSCSASCLARSAG